MDTPAPHMEQEVQHRTRCWSGAIIIAALIALVCYIWATYGVPLWFRIGVTIVSIGLAINVTRGCRNR